MAHAATATSNDASAPVQRAGEYSAFLRLRQGSSARATWVLEEAPGGTMLSVGADPACDWQIRAAFVPPRAFSVLVVGGRTFVRSGPEPGVLVNGKPLDDGWNELQQNARIDIGLARIEVSSGHDAQGDEPVLELVPSRKHEPRNDDAHVTAHAVDATVHEVQDEPSRVIAMPTSRDEHPQVVPIAVVKGHALETPARSGSRRKSTMETQEYASPALRKAIADAQARVRPVGGKPRNSTIELKLEDLDYVGTIPLPHRSDRYDYERSGEYAVAPSLLGNDERTAYTGKPRNWRWAVAGVGLVGAYSGWLYILDQL